MPCANNDDSWIPAKKPTVRLQVESTYLVLIVHALHVACSCTIYARTRPHAVHGSSCAGHLHCISNFITKANPLGCERFAGYG